MKISVVMQSYLGDYPGSRKYPEFKFVRAVHSFISQTHENKELIIVSDGCNKTKELYERLYSHDPRIKFAYISKKQEKNMYEIDEVDGKKLKYHRGIPRGIGCVIAQGDIITYMDSDDLMLPHRLSDIYEAWKDKSDNVKWSSNPLRLFHKNSQAFVEKKTEGVTDFSKPLDIRKYGYDIADPFFVNVAVPKGYICVSSPTLVHRKNVKAQWKDTVKIYDKNDVYISGLHEDHQFLKEMQETEGAGFRQESASYVICHYSKVWDV